MPEGGNVKRVRSTLNSVPGGERVIIGWETSRCNVLQAQNESSHLYVTTAIDIGSAALH